VTLPWMNSIRSIGKLAGLPVLRSSRTRTRRPAAASASTRCEPMNPAPPVTRHWPTRRLLEIGFLPIVTYILVTVCPAYFDCQLLIVNCCFLPHPRLEMRSLAKSTLWAMYRYTGAMQAQERLAYLAGRRFVTILLFHRITDEIPLDGLTVSTS